MPWGSLATKALANSRGAPGSDSTDRYCATIVSEATAGPVYDGAVLSREVTTDLTVLERLVPLSGRDVIDIGCGGGVLVRALSARGARVTGVEISESQLAATVRDDDGSGARYVVGVAQRLPLAEGSADVVVFMRTLHHVPPAEMLSALREAVRVLRPGGIAYISEPLSEGDFFELTSLVEDEREVRAAAQLVIADAGEVGLDRVESIEYDVRLCLAGLDALAARVVSVDPARGAVFEERKVTIAEAFTRLGEPGRRPGERCFLAPMRVDVLRVAG
jgi:2-polyprenyl-3-methyl-5-hydroxy-6-metoxy-1,4-benzoquinol methylase